MTAEQLWQQFRVEVDDRADPPLWPFDEFLLWLNEAQDEAAVRARLLFDATTAEVCLYEFAAEQGSQALHEAVDEITNARFVETDSGEVRHLCVVSRLELESRDRNWRAMGGLPRFLLNDETHVQIVPAPALAGELRIECHRLPLVRIKNDGDTPEVHAKHHAKLLLWVVHRAFAKPDSETMDPRRSAEAEAKFIGYFGHRPDAQARRVGMADRPQFNQAYW